ncbi:hypothetical protein Z042_12240 [Chania multitudinisentens RB-25]|uniref:Uncharacterized protein n=2 Tax=Chania TaxID=1745211 RepID=W0LG90_9GAMM|nr:hypothetical protein Z042_12240 [Chania multitudinisentens RB-25]
MHRFAVDKNEIKTLETSGWTNEGVVFYAQTPPNDDLPALGINLGNVDDWSSEHFFNDAMKQARPFAAVSAAWEGLNTPIATDANGWPLGDAGVLPMAVNADHLQVKPHPSGSYKLSFKGQGTAQMVVKAGGKLLTVTYDALTQTYYADVNYDNKSNLYFTFEGIVGGVKDVRLLRPQHYASDTFNAVFLQRLKAEDNKIFGIIRFMETTGTNGSKIAEWSERTAKSYATQQRQFKGRPAGMSWEYVIELSNMTGKDPWINVPHLASDDYIRNLALLFKNNLNSERKLYIEFSNEVWNELEKPYFAQRKEVGKAACDKVLISGDPDNYYSGLSGNKANCLTYKTEMEYAFLGRHYAWKVKHISDIFREVFGDAAMMTRVRPMLAWENWSLRSTKAGKLPDQLQYLNQMYGSPHNYIYGISTSAYIEMISKAGDTPSNLMLSVDEILERMNEYVQTVSVDRFHAMRDLADQYNLKMFAYEGGPSLLDKVNFDNKLAANSDPRMKEIIKTLLQNWQDAGGDTFIYYMLASSYASHGFWGLSEQLDDENTVKWQALKEKFAEWQ